MKYFTLIICISFSLISKSQIKGNWYFNSNVDLFKTDTLKAFKTCTKDTTSVLRFDTSNYVEYCSNYFVTNLEIGTSAGIMIHCEPNEFSESRYLKYNDTLQIIFFNPYFPLTDLEIKKLNHTELKEHYKTFGESRIIYFKIIIDTSEKIILVKMNVP